jgi:hypothetical protein
VLVADCGDEKLDETPPSLFAGVGDDRRQRNGGGFFPDAPPDSEDAPLKKAVVKIGCGKFVAKLFVKVLENATISGLHGSEILG